MLTNLTADNIIAQPENIKTKIKDFLAKLIGSDQLTREKLSYDEIISEYGRDSPTEAKLLKEAFYKAFLINDVDETGHTTNTANFQFWTKFMFYSLSVGKDKPELQRFIPFSGSPMTAGVFDRALEVFLFYLTNGKNKHDYKSFLKYDPDGKKINDYLRDNLVGYQENQTLLSFLSRSAFDPKKGVEHNNFVLIDFMLAVIKLARNQSPRLVLPDFSEVFVLPELGRHPLPFFDTRCDLVRRMHAEVVERNAALPDLLNSLTTIKGKYSFLFGKNEIKECYWLHLKFDEALRGRDIYQLVANDNFDEVVMDYKQHYIESAFLHNVWATLIQ